jgi:PAS domain S-box-containing protein
VCVILVMSVFQVYDVLRRLDIVLNNAQRELATTVRLLAEQTGDSLRAVDLVLKHTGVLAPRRTGRADGRVQQLLRDAARDFRQIRELALLPAADASAANGLPGASLHAQLTRAEAPRFDELQVSAAFFLPAVGSWTVALSRPWRDGDGRLQGLIIAYMDLEHVRRFYGGLDLPPGSHICLLAQDASRIVEHPVDADAIGQPFAEQETYRALLASGQAASRLMTSPVDGTERLYAAQAVPGFPFAVGASMSKSALLAPWYVQATHSAARTISLCVSVALLMWLVLRQLRRREQAEAQLRVQTASLDELIESAPEAIAMLDLEGRVARVNREFTRMFGYAPEEVRGRAISALIVPADLQQESQRMAQAVAAGQHVSTETERQRSDGTRFAVSALSAPIVAATGPIATFAIYRDITERRFAEGERAKLESRLRQAEKLEAIGTMAGGIAHDFNGILSAILAHGNLALEPGQDEGARTRCLVNILSAADRGRGLVEQILTYSRSTRGRREVVRVNAVVQDALELLRASLPANVELHTHLDAQETLIVADPTHLHQLLMNLCSNALHSMEGGGVLDVTLDERQMTTDAVVSHGVLSATRYVVLRVRDTGHGMAPAVLERIFEPFFTTRQAGLGTGLGLAMVYAIITDLGGAIDVHSTEGTGSTFTLYLPAAEAAAVEGTGGEAGLPRGHGERVLLVEDEPALMLLEEEMLAALNYEPAGFTNATEALAEFLADPERFDAVLLDQLMPGMTGIELAKRMRAARDRLPILLITAYRGPFLAQEARAAAVHEILPKPLDFRRLAQALHQVLRAHGTDQPEAAAEPSGGR